MRWHGEAATCPRSGGTGYRLAPAIARGASRAGESGRRSGPGRVPARGSLPGTRHRQCDAASTTPPPSSCRRAPAVRFSLPTTCSRNRNGRAFTPAGCPRIDNNSWGDLVWCARGGNTSPSTSPRTGSTGAPASRAPRSFSSQRMPATAERPLRGGGGQRFPKHHVYSGGWEHFAAVVSQSSTATATAGPDIFVAGGEAPARPLMNASSPGNDRIRCDGTDAPNRRDRGLHHREIYSKPKGRSADLATSGSARTHSGVEPAIAVRRMRPDEMGFNGERWSKTAFSATWKTARAGRNLANRQL